MLGNSFIKNFTVIEAGTDDIVVGIDRFQEGWTVAQCPRVFGWTTRYCPTQTGHQRFKKRQAMASHWIIYCRATIRISYRMGRTNLTDAWGIQGKVIKWKYCLSYRSISQVTKVYLISVTIFLKIFFCSLDLGSFNWPFFLFQTFLISDVFIIL